MLHFHLGHSPLWAGEKSRWKRTTSMLEKHCPRGLWQRWAFEMFIPPWNPSVWVKKWEAVHCQDLLRVKLGPHSKPPYMCNRKYAFLPTTREYLPPSGALNVQDVADTTCSRSTCMATLRELLLSLYRGRNWCSERLSSRPKNSCSYTRHGHNLRLSISKSMPSFLLPATYLVSVDHQQRLTRLVLTGLILQIGKLRPTEWNNIHTHLGFQPMSCNSKGSAGFI